MKFKTINGAPICGAKVKVMFLGELVAVLTTDSNGEVRASGLTKGRKYVVSSKDKRIGMKEIGFISTEEVEIISPEGKA